MYDSDLWAGGNGKHRRVRLELSVGINRGLGWISWLWVWLQEIRTGKLIVEWSGHFLFFLQTRGRKASNAVPICIEKGIQWRRIKKPQHLFCCVLFVGEMRSGMRYTVQRCSRWHVGGSGWRRRRESVCGQPWRMATKQQSPSYWCSNTSVHQARKRVQLFTSSSEKHMRECFVMALASPHGHSHRNQKHQMPTWMLPNSYSI